jgi:hypothetical protein
MMDLDDSPTAILQLMQDLEQLGFHADFTLHDGLELTIRKKRRLQLDDFAHFLNQTPRTLR